MKRLRNKTYRAVSVNVVSTNGDFLLSGKRHSGAALRREICLLLCLASPAALRLTSGGELLADVLAEHCLSEVELTIVCQVIDGRQVCLAVKWRGAIGPLAAHGWIPASATFMDALHALRSLSYLKAGVSGQSFCEVYDYQQAQGLLAVGDNPMNPAESLEIGSMRCCDGANGNIFLLLDMDDLAEFFYLLSPYDALAADVPWVERRDLAVWLRTLRRLELADPGDEGVVMPNREVENCLGFNA